MTKIVLKHGTGVPSDADLEVAEVAIDNVSGAMYTKLADDSVKHLNAAGASSWNDLTDKPTEYPPEAHTQDWSTITNTPADYPPSAHGHAWDEITGKPTEFPPSSHDHDGVYQPVGDYIEDADSDGKQYARQDGAWSEIVIPDGGSGTGAGMVILETEPVDPVEGMQWLNPTNGLVLFWDGAKWLQFPGGRDGEDGVDGLWTDEGNDLISYSGNIEVGGTAKANTVSASASGAYTLDLSDTQNFVLTLSGAVSLSATGGREGQTGFIKFIQGAGGDTVSISGDFVTPDGGGVTLSSDAGAVDVVPYVFSGGVVLGNTTMGVA